MARLLLRRLLLALPTVLAAATLAFLLAHLAPGSPAVALGGEFGAPGLLEELAGIQGFNRPLPVLYMEWLGRLLQGDLGFSFRTQTRVAVLIADRLPVTLALLLPAIILSTAIGITLGAAGTRGRNTIVAGLAGLQALPTYLVAQALVLVFAVGFDLLPVQGIDNPRNPPSGFWATLLTWSRHLALPVAALTLNQLCFVALLTRARMGEELSRLYILTARSKGLSESATRRRHALPNALLPLLTLFCSRLGALISGALVIETVFALPGLGRLAVNAAIARDHPTVIGIVLVASVAIVLANMAVDLLHLWLDPRPPSGRR